MRNRVALASALILLFGAGFTLYQRSGNLPKGTHEVKLSSNHLPPIQGAHVHAANGASVTPAPPLARQPAQQAAPLSTPPQTEAQSLDFMGRTLGQIATPSFTFKGLLEDLQKTGQEPLVVRDANPDTGEMLIVRTKSPLPGTRYFHAQYFTGDDGEKFVQHMSFEFKPGPDAMAEAVAAVERNFAGLSRPMVQRADYVKWEMNNHYIVWVKKMTAQDLKDDPFNAYSISDNGTIRVAVELEIHGE